ncbi:MULTISPECIES: hypothetical protein [Anaerosinus]|uniref:Uncharacterized protein n=1 Tax=Selenobaculum gibii TaxID=3054208 RepID=A0A9Y2AK44_9FIRM|nr:hypothetical protein [Selenobaculum gbiensis]WIW71392.1 hypothetical protein P3F81_03510 [Selenobaculum gbiensis]
MRNFKVRVEGTEFELEVEEEKSVPLVILHGDHHAWVEAGHKNLMNSH